MLFRSGIIEFSNDITMTLLAINISVESIFVQVDTPDAPKIRMPRSFADRSLSFDYGNILMNILISPQKVIANEQTTQIRTMKTENNKRLTKIVVG